jgi:hypothetical protein
MFGSLVLNWNQQLLTKSKYPHNQFFCFQNFDRENLANFFKNKFEFIKITLETEHFFSQHFHFLRGVKTPPNTAPNTGKNN